MSDERDHDPLRAEFGRLRAETEGDGTAPDFRTMMAGAKAEAAVLPSLEVTEGGAPRPESTTVTTPNRAPRRARRIGGWATVAAAAAVVGLVIVSHRAGDADADFERLVASYSREATLFRSPTSGLLDVPGMALTRSMPSFGSTLRGLDPSTRPSGDPADGRGS